MADQDDDERLEQEYAQQFGRAPDQNERTTDLANVQKYGFEGVQRGLAERATNTPNQDGGSNANATPASAWNTQGGGAQGGGLYPEWYNELMPRNLEMQAQQQAQTQGRSDALYTALNSRATQGLNVSPQDATIRAQVDPFRAEQDRAQRNFISDTAERSGPLANIQGERRMAAEKVGQNVSGFQGELMARELQSKRDEIAQALQQQGAMLSGDQQRQLQSQLAAMDQAIAEAGVGLGQQDLNLRGELGRGNLALGQGHLALGNRSLDVNQDQWQRELGLRQWQLGDESDLNWARL